MMKKMSLLGALVICVVALFVGIAGLKIANNETSHLDDIAKFYVEHEHNDISNASYEIIDADENKMTIYVKENGEVRYISNINIEWVEGMMERKDS